MQVAQGQNVSDKEGFLPLHYAVLNQDGDTIQELLADKCGEFGIIIVLCHCTRNYLNSCIYFVMLLLVW